jgi:hypothetical protein
VGMPPVAGPVTSPVASPHAGHTTVEKYYFIAFSLQYFILDMLKRLYRKKKRYIERKNKIKPTYLEGSR